MKFEDLNLSAALLRAVREEGYEIATPIQQQAIPAVLEGRDLLGCAQTGTGKTAAFALPTMHRLAERLAVLAAAAAEQHPPHAAPAQHAAGAAPEGALAEQAWERPARQHEPRRDHRSGDRRGYRNDRHERGADRRPVRVLVLAPTRELASQIAESFRTYGRYTHLRHAAIFGGVSQVPQEKMLSRGVDVLIATPGRLCDLMQQRIVNLSHVEVLILDEADQMLDMGFVPDLRRIIAQVPRERQTLFFSATMPPEIRRLADQWLSDPVTVSVVPQGTTAERVQQALYFVPQRDKPQLLVNYIREQQCRRTLVFTRTKHGADKLVKSLLHAGMRAEAIHGNKSQNARQRALALFKGQHPPILVATDIASRGLDIDGVSHVINFDLPLTPEAYVHRIGRTARAGAEGQAVLFVNAEERSMLREIERLIRMRISAVNTPTLPRAPGDGPDDEAHAGDERYAEESAQQGSDDARSGEASRGPRTGRRPQRQFRSGGRPAFAPQGQGRPFQKRKRFGAAHAAGSGDGQAHRDAGHHGGRSASGNQAQGGQPSGGQGGGGYASGGKKPGGGKRRFSRRTPR